MTKVLIVGFGVSGKSVYSFLSQKGIETVIADDKAGKVEASVPVVLPQDIVLDDISFAVVSPGVPLTHPLCQRLKAKNIECICDIELGLRLYNPKGPLVGITGTNGKTTTTGLVTHILQCAGLKALAVGNVGTTLMHPILQHLDNDGPLIVELSSFQLSMMSTQKFSMGLVLNISPNHLDHHVSMEEYVSCKMHLKDLVNGPFFVHESLNCPHAHTFGLKNGSDVHVENNQVVRHGVVETLLPQKLLNKLSHDTTNFLAAYSIARELKVSPEVCVESYETFSKPPHRIEFVAKKNGVSFFNDSKATNIDAVLKAVESMDGPVVLIAGGVHKGEPYTAWKPAFKDKVRLLVLIGQAAKLIEQDIDGAVPIVHAKSFEEAVFLAFQAAKPNENVLLSPGCSSFDMFQNYKERGDTFQKLVKEISL